MKQKLLFLLPLFQTFLSAELPSSYSFSQEQVAAYNKSASYQLDSAVRMLDKEFFSGAERILDVGCGDGKITAWFAEKFPKCSIVGSDVSQSMIAFALDHYKYPNLKFVEKNACKLGYANTFDRVVSFNALHWISDQQTALKEIYASLKTGGKAMLVVQAKSSHNDLLNVGSKLCASSKWRSYFQTYRSVHSFHTEEEYKQMLENAKFSIEKLESNVHEGIFETRQSFEQWVSPVLTPMHHLPAEKKKEFLDDLFVTLEEKGCVDIEGKVHIHFGQIQMIAIKK
ncbi:MAG: methyltransferase domain-containing protein [Candidatus Melainabacteria bacterium]|nr:methyltransferase domain-containing protein [Candidatus Melainabacteria bacterium]